MVIALLVLLVVLGPLTYLFGHDSRDGMDWRGYDEALRLRIGGRRHSSWTRSGQ